MSRLAGTCSRSLASFSVDWEELLSGYLGDVAAHQLGNGGRAAAQWLAETRATLERDIAEYLRNEAELLPERWQIRQFLTAVDELRSDIDRLDARIKRLYGRLRGRQRNGRRDRHRPVHALAGDPAGPDPPWPR